MCVYLRRREYTLAKHNLKFSLVKILKAKKEKGKFFVIYFSPILFKPAEPRLLSGGVISVMSCGISFVWLLYGLTNPHIVLMQMRKTQGSWGRNHRFHSFCFLMCHWYRHACDQMYCDVAAQILTKASGDEEVMSSSFLWCIEIQAKHTAVAAVVYMLHLWDKCKV